MNDTPAGSSLVVFEAQRTPHAAVVAFRDGYRSGSSRVSMLAVLSRCAVQLSGGAVTDPAMIPWHHLRYEHVRSFGARLAELGLSPATQAARLGAVRRIVEECWKLGLTDRDTLDRIRSVRPQKRDVNAPPAGRVLEPHEQAALFAAAAAGKGAAAQRDTALLSLGLGGGLRREELAGLPLWNGELGYDVDRHTIIVRGKGGKRREVPLGTLDGSRLAAWLEVRGTKTGPFLLALHAQSFHAPRVTMPFGLSPAGVYSMLAGLGFRARIKDFSPHDLRRTFVTELLEAGVDPITTARMAGHDDVKTTMRYDRRGERARVAAAAMLAKHREGKP